MPGPLPRSVLAASLVLMMFTVARPAGPPVVQSSRVDAVGDPLPDDALARFGTARFRDANFYGVSLSPDGKLLAVPGMGEIRLLDTTSGKEVRRIKGQGPTFHHGTITFSSDGKFLALADHSNITVCDVVKAEVLSQFKPSGRFGQGSVSFSGDGKLLAVGGQGFREKLSVTIWDVAAKKEKKKIESVYDRLVHAALSGDGKTLGVWGQASDRQEQPVLRLLDVETGKERLALKADGYSFQHVVFSPDGKQFLTVEQGFPLSIREAATGKVLRQFAACANPAIVKYSADGKVLAVGSTNATVQLFDAHSGRRLGQCKAPPQTNVGSVGFLPGNRVLAAGYAHSMLRLWDVPSGRERTPAKGHLASVSSLAFSRDGKTLNSAGADGVRVHALTTGKELRWIEPPADEFGRFRRGNRAASFLSPHGRYTIWSDPFGRGMTVMDLSSLEEIAHVGSSSNPFVAAVAFAPDGAGLATLGMEVVGKTRQTTADVWDLESGLLKRRIKVPASGYAWALALSPGGKTLVAAAAQNFGRQANERIALWDVASGKETGRLPLEFSSFMAFSPDGSLLAASANGTVSLYDAATGRLIHSLEGAANNVNHLFAFSPDGRTLAAARGGVSDEISLWELASGKVRATYPGHRGGGGALALAFSPDGRTLASGGFDTTVMLWDVTGVSVAARRREGKPTEGRWSELWADLDSADAAKAHRAMAQLQVWPAETLALFRKELKAAPGKPPAIKEVQQWIADLGDDSFDVREKANRKLSEAGLAVRSALLAALAVTPELEKKRRLEELLRALQPGLLTDRIRPARALEILERLASPEARRVVQTLADGNPGARLTLEAGVVLKRMTRKP